MSSTLAEVRMPVQAVVLAIAVCALAVGVGACGGSGKSKSTSSAAAAQSAKGPVAEGNGGPSVASGPVRASLSGPDHAPAAGKLWPYTVKATDPRGRPVSGTVDTEFAFAGQVVGRESPPTHPLKNGMLHDMVTFPPQSVGQPITLQVVIHTAQATVTLDWPVTPKK
jgi:hypothetical protein